MLRAKVNDLQETFLRRTTLKSYIECVKNLLDITLSCRSPSGTIKIIQNACGGNLTITSSSRILFQSLAVRKPIIQLLVSTAQGHLNAFSDGGLFLVSLAADIVLRSLESGKNTKHLAEIYEECLMLCADYFHSDHCVFKYSALLSDIQFMIIYIKGILGSKPFCQIDEQRVEYISRLVLESFVNSISELGQGTQTADMVYIVKMEGLDVWESILYNGLILTAPDLSSFTEAQLKSLKKRKANDKDVVKVALITASMSGDVDEMSHVKYEVNANVDIDGVIVEDLKCFCESLIQLGVRLVLCQKVVHPQLKLQFSQAGVILMDRIGIQPINYIAKVTGCSPIHCLSYPVPDELCGWTDDVLHLKKHKKSYLHLVKENTPVTTLILCHQQEQSLNELAEVCRTSLSSLQQLLYSPYVLCGAGCWQVGLVTYLLNKVDKCKVQMSQDMGCSIQDIEEAFVMFTQSLIKVSIKDPQHVYVNNRSGHAFHLLEQEMGRPVKCCCGLYTAEPEDEYTSITFSHFKDFVANGCGNAVVQKQLLVTTDFLHTRNIVMDCFSMSQSALQTAVLTACSVLNIVQIVEMID